MLNAIFLSRLNRKREVLMNLPVQYKDITEIKLLFLKNEASCYPIFSQINMPELRYLKKSVLKIVPFWQHTYRASNQHIKKKMLI